MKRSFGFLAASLAAAIALFGCAYVPPQGEGWINLFDGTNLNNWTRVGNANWRLLGGVVQADSSDNTGYGYLVSKNTYRDFIVRVEVWVSHDGNTGVFMRCANAKKIDDRTCYEANIFDQRKDQRHGTGAITHLAQVSPMPKAGGRWNVIEVTAIGPELTVVLNGNPTVHLRDTQFASGPIALQWGGQGIVKFRKVDIKPL